MAVTSRGVPRFLPTLTEVVHAPPPVEEPEEAPEGGLDQEAIAERVRLQVETMVEGRLPAMVSAALLAQVGLIVERLREDIEPMLRQAVEEAVMHETGLRRRN